MQQYLDALQHILNNGVDKEDRTGIGTKSVFGYQMRFDLSQDFPATTTKRLAFKAVTSELLWMIEGSGNERRLAEILHGTKHLNDKKTIWTANAEAEYWKPRGLGDGDLGRVYGVQWRHWKKVDGLCNCQECLRWGCYCTDPDGLCTCLCDQCNTEIDQLALLIQGIKDNPSSRRHILTAWNPAELDQMALPPCHMTAQFYVVNKQLSCQLYQRSCDMFLGVPFNIASYSLLTHMIAQICGIGVGDFVWTGGDCHIYNNHFDAVNEQLHRKPEALPHLSLNANIDSIDNFRMIDISLINYNPQSTITAPMAV
jgi:thymidylate synthase